MSPLFHCFSNGNSNSNVITLSCSTQTAQIDGLPGSNQLVVDVVDAFGSL